METNTKKNTTRKKPCPKGFHRNKKGDCEEKKNTLAPSTLAPATLAPIAEQIAEPIAEQIAEPIAEPIAEQAKTTNKKTTRKKPCPKGFHRNKKGDCEQKKNTQAPATLGPTTLGPTTLGPTTLGPTTLAPAIEEPTTLGPAIEEPDAPLNIQNERKNKLELLEREESTTNTDYDFLYPSLNDKEFNIKIAERKEFNDNQYDGEILPDIAAQAELLCNAEFELAPHQIFVRNFLSFQTPYNSLLLYHGLGSGKTCSAISVAEEMRDYMMQMGITSQIMIVASPNVQVNFRVQLFDERKLKEVDGLWNIRDCIGNKFLKEINPMNMKGLSKENVIKQINRLIDTYYLFYGYVEFANYISKNSKVEDESLPEKKKEAIIRSKLRSIFNNRLIIIDEIHNIRVSDDTKHVPDEVVKLVKHVSTLRLLLLSATPMFNNYKEIIWLVNLMNLNDRRATIETRDVFNSDGSFKVNAAGEEIGRELLERKATGYISFVRGENPYTFPYRLWPKEFAPSKTFPTIAYPTIQLNGTSDLTQPIEHLSLYMVDIGVEQQKGYNYIIQRIKGGHIGNYKQMPNLENIETFGYTMMQQPLQVLNMFYPDERLLEAQPTFNSIELVGGEGLKRHMTFIEDPSTSLRSKFEYLPETLQRYGRLFSPTEIGKYSSKIKTICEQIMKSTGIVLIYSQYKSAGLVPMVLALEELGFTRAGNVPSLFATPPTAKRAGSSYVMITGDKSFSPNPAQDIKMVTNEDNMDGKQVKVVLITQTGAEGLDLKFIRQIHILEPWYNMNRVEQIIGRGVRTCSHKSLPFAQRNVEIYLYGSLMRDEGKEETADLYTYRLAETKAIQIGKVSRLLKEISIDCILNYGQLNFTEENMAANGVKPVTLELASGIKINYKVGDKPYSAMCDYMESCSYMCRPNKEINEDDVRLDTYNENFIMMNRDKLILKIKQLMKERFFYRKKDLVVLLNVLKPYPLVQINAALHQLVEDKTEYIIDKYGRQGNMINVGDLYLFQPLELNQTNSSIYERSVPLDVKHETIDVKLPKEIKVNEAIIKLKENPAAELNMDLYTRIRNNYNLANTAQIVMTGEKNWYMFCQKGVAFLVKNGYALNLLQQLISEHIVDELYLPDILAILNDLQNPIYETQEVFKYIKIYLTRQTLTVKNLKGFLWKEKGTQVLLCKTNEEEQWHQAQPEDLNDFEAKLNEQKKNILTNLNSLMGFMLNFNKEEFVVFKIKNINNPRDKGARCDQSSKSKGIEVLNSIVSSANLSSALENYKYPPEKNISQKEVCVIQELYLRLYDKERKNKKRWFLSPPEAILTKIDNYSTVVKKVKNKKEKK